MTDTDIRKTNHYTVCYLFDPDLENVLLVRKSKTDFAGQLNGCGGTVEQGEDALRGALREIHEETGLIEPDLAWTDEGKTEKLAWLGDLVLPYDCKAHTGQCMLHLYAGRLKPGAVDAVKAETDTGEKLVWEPVADLLATTLASGRYAGAGDLQYFVNQGLARFRGTLSGLGHAAAARTDYEAAWKQFRAAMESDLEQAEADETYRSDAAPAELFKGFLDYMDDIEKRFSGNAGENR